MKIKVLFKKRKILHLIREYYSQDVVDYIEVCDFSKAFFENFDEDFFCDEGHFEDNVAALISKSFYWLYSKEGSEYWSNLVTSLSELGL